MTKQLSSYNIPGFQSAFLPPSLAARLMVRDEHFEAAVRALASDMGDEVVMVRGCKYADTKGGFRIYENGSVGKLAV